MFLVVEGHLLDIVKFVEEGIGGTELSVLLTNDLKLFFTCL